jgi:hypothetical protein
MASKNKGETAFLQKFYIRKTRLFRGTALEKLDTLIDI